MELTYEIVLLFFWPWQQAINHNVYLTIIEYNSILSAKFNRLLDMIYHI